jgi:hypothetical protein
MYVFFSLIVSYFILKKVIFFWITKSLNPGDDAVTACFLPLKEILSGDKRLAFNHYNQLLMGLKSSVGFIPNHMMERLFVLSDLASHYIYLLKVEINKVIDEKNASGENFLRFDNLYQQFNVDIYKDYLFFEKFTTPHPDDIDGCTNEWCLKEGNQMETPQKAVDVVLTIKYFGETYLLVITRMFAPGKNCYALVGGFVDEGETFEEASYRELEEEVGKKLGFWMKYLEPFSSVGLIEPYITTTHDPRPKFIVGMELGGIGFNINLDMLDFVFCVCALLSLFLK